MTPTPPKPLFWTVTGRDFGRAIRAARARGNPLAAELRRRVHNLSANFGPGCKRARGLTPGGSA